VLAVYELFCPTALDPAGGAIDVNSGFDANTTAAAWEGVLTRVTTMGDGEAGPPVGEACGRDVAPDDGAADEPTAGGVELG